MADNFIPGELHSYKRKLATLRQAELEAFLQDLIRRDRLHPELIPDIAKAVANSPYYFSAVVLAEVIIATKSPYLQSQLQSQWEARIAEDTMTDGVFKLMKACPTESLERALCHRLINTTGDLRLLFFKPIAEVLSEKGGAYSLETIESLLFDLEPEGKVAHSVAQAISSHIDSQSEDNPIELTDGQVERLMNDRELSLLIAPLKTARDVLRAKLYFEEIIAPASLMKVDEAHKAIVRGGKFLQEAREKLGMGQKEDAAKQCRCAAEAFCKAVWWAKNNNNKMNNKVLEDIKQSLKTSVFLPESIEKAIGLVQQYSVYGAHDKVYEDNPLSDDVVKACLSETERIADWATQVVDEKNTGRFD